MFSGLIYISKKKIFFKLLKTGIIVSLLSTVILYFDTVYRPDANLYHLPYTRIINDEKIIFGIANIHFRFGHISILQYLNAIFNNFLFGKNGILIPAAIIFSTFILFFINEIIKNYKDNKIYSFYVFLLLTYALYGYNRYSEFGNDTIGHLYLFLTSMYFLKYNHKKDVYGYELSYILILSLFCFMLKTSLILIFILPLYIFLKNYKKEYIFNYSIVLLVFAGVSWLTKNFITSGCLIYPIEVTCFEGVNWFSNNINYQISAKLQSLDNEAWTKDWSNYKGPSITQEEYVKNFFWLKTWLSVHGIWIFKKIIIFIIALTLINLIIKIKINGKAYEKSLISNRIIFLFYFALLCTVIWFLRFPLYRYGSSYIVILLISMSTIVAIKSNLKFIDDIVFKKFLTISLIIFFTFFVLKHIQRINKNYDSPLVYGPWPKFLSSENTTETSYIKKIDEKIFYYRLKENKNGCDYTNSPCTPYPVNNVYLSRLYGYKFYNLIK